MKKRNVLLEIFCVGLFLVFQAACGPTSSSARTTDNPVINQETPTITPSGSFGSAPDERGDLPSEGILSINFVDALVGEVCTFELPIELAWNEGQGAITGETEASCALSAVMCGDACITMNSDWELEVSVSGTVYIDEADAPDGEIHADFVFSGTLTNYASEWPEGAIPAFTIEQPFIIEQPGLILPLVLPLKVGASTSISSEGGGEPINVLLQSLSP